MRSSQVRIVADTLRVALLDAARRASEVAPAEAEAMGAAARSIAGARPGGGEGAADGSMPAPGATAERLLTVTEEDTAHALGHPDPAVSVLGTPRLALWFEVVSSQLLPEPSPEQTHVGAGVLVHHLAPAGVGEVVRVRARLEEVHGRRALFSCEAWVGDRLAGLGAHHRALVKAPGAGPRRA